MKRYLSFFTFFFFISKVYFFQELDDSDDDADEDVAFDSFKKKFKRSFSSDTDYQHRKAVFKDNLKKIRNHNKKPSVSYTQGINDYTDLSWDEFKAKYLGKDSTNRAASTQVGASTNPTYTTPSLYIIPSGRENEMKDWRTVTSPKPVIGPIKNQGGCGSCWAFSGVGAVESAYVIFKNDNPILSEQQLVDCSGSYGNAACNGGWETSAMSYIRDKGVVLSNNYPYVTSEKNCDSSIIQNNTPYKIKSWSFLAKGPEAIIQALKRQPVTASIYVGSSFQYYRSGIYTVSSCNLWANHALMTVAYSLTPGNPYFVLRNQWGTSWGESGYMKLSMRQGDGVCGFSTNQAAAYPSF